MIPRMKGRPSTDPSSQCVKCGHGIVKRTATKILVQSGTYGTPRTLCWICNRCLPSFLDELEVSMPDDTPRPYTPRRMCRKCYNYVGKYANYCQHCGNDLNDHKEE